MLKFLDVNQILEQCFYLSLTLLLIVYIFYLGFLIILKIKSLIIKEPDVIMLESEEFPVYLDNP